MSKLPPLAAVRVFEAAARHENFTAAAAELGMTQAAVSYQIKLLEERLGVALFRRDKKRVALTEAGRRAAPDLSRAFELMEGAFAQLRVDDGAMLTITTSQTFGNAWFAWRLGAFQMAHPEMAIRLMVGDDVVDLNRADVDVAVRSSIGKPQGWSADFLLNIDFTPMCSPAFLEQHGGRLEPADLLRVPIISPHENWWTHWLREAGIDVPEGPIRPGVRLDSQAHEGNAAIAGQGVAMLTPFFWRNDMAAGRLVAPFEQISTRGYSYWIVCPQHRRNTPKIKRFREWLMREVGRDLARMEAGEEPEQVGVISPGWPRGI